LNGWLASHSLSARLLVYSFEHILSRGGSFFFLPPALSLSILLFCSD
jgi:hypothetical protein